GGAGARRPRPARGDRAQVRGRAGRPVDAGRRPRRGAGHGRGRVRALPPAARVPPADAARADRHRPRTRPRRGRTGGAGRLPLLTWCRTSGGVPRFVVALAAGWSGWFWAATVVQTDVRGSGAA